MKRGDHPTVCPRFCRALGFLWVLLGGLWVAACSGGGSGGASISQGDADQQAYNRSAKETREHAEAFTQAILGEGGLVEKGLLAAGEGIGKRKALQTEPSDLKAINAYVDQLEAVQQHSARMLVSSLTGLEALVRFSERAERDFEGEDETQDAGVGQVQKMRRKGVVLASLVAIGVAYTIYSAFKSVDEAVRDSQKIVHESIAADPAYAEKVKSELQDRGVQVPDNIDAAGLSKLFNEQGREVRRQITNEVRALNIERMGNSQQQSDVDGLLAESDRQNIKETSVKLGKVAVKQVVAGSQAATGGVGELLGGKELGAGVELTLTLTETDPMSLVEKHVEARVESQSKQPVDLSYGGEEVVSKGDETLVLTQLSEGRDAGSLWAAGHAAYLRMYQLIERYKKAIANAGQIDLMPEKLVFASGDLNEKPSATGDGYDYELTLTVPGFDESEPYEVEILSEDHLHEDHTESLSGNATIPLQHIPLLGTIAVTTVMGDYTAEDHTSQAYTAEVSISKVPDAVQVLSTIENGTVTPRTKEVGASGQLTLTGEIMGDAQLVVRRYDTGESYLKTMSLGEADEEDTPQGGGGGIDPALLGRWTYVDDDNNHYHWTFSADGTAKQQVKMNGELTTHNWEWTADGSTLTLSYNGGQAAVHQYKVVGNKLYIATGSDGAYGEPFTHD